MKLKVKGKTSELHFGFGCFRKLGEANGLETYDETIKLLSDTLESTGSLSFKQEDLIKQLLEIAAVDQLDLTEVNLMEILVENPTMLNDLVLSVQASMPQFAKTEGKQQARKPRKAVKKS